MIRRHPWLTLILVSVAVLLIFFVAFGTGGYQPGTGDEDFLRQP